MWKTLSKQEAIDKSLELYRREKQIAIDAEFSQKKLELDRDIQTRKENNWIEVDEARTKKIERVIEVNIELAKLEASAELMKNQVEATSAALKAENACLVERVKFLENIVQAYANKPVPEVHIVNPK